MMAAILSGAEGMGGGGSGEKTVLRKGGKEQQPNCGNQETGETNGSAPLLREITKHL